MRLKLMFFFCLFAVERTRFVSGIYGGRVVAKNAFPNMAAVFGRTTEESELEMFSAGTIYTENWILISASSCSQIEVKYPKKYVIVKVGKPNFRLTEPYEQVRSILEFHTHTDYNPTEVAASVNLGLIKLNVSLIFNEFVNKLIYDTIGGPASGSAEVVGWGVSNRIEIEMGVLSNVLKSAYVEIMTENQCKYSIFFVNLINKIEMNYYGNFHFCTGSFASTVGPSMGDVGGPILKKNNIGRYYVIGIISAWPEPPGKVGPSLYIDISKFGQWLIDVSNDVQ